MVYWQRSRFLTYKYDLRISWFYGICSNISISSETKSLNNVFVGEFLLTMSVRWWLWLNPAIRCSLRLPWRSCCSTSDRDTKVVPFPSETVLRIRCRSSQIMVRANSVQHLPCFFRLCTSNLFEQHPSFLMYWNDATWNVSLIRVDMQFQRPAYSRKLYFACVRTHEGFE